MSKDLIKKELTDWLNQKHKTIHSDWIEYYKSSKYLSTPYKIFENYFHLFWLDIKKYPLRTMMKEDYFKVIMFNDCIKFLRADFDQYFTKTGSGKKNSYKITEEQSDDLMELFRGYFFIPNLIVYVLENRNNKVEALLNKNRTYPIRFMKMIKKIETTVKPKPKQDQAIIEANRLLKIFDESDLINQDGFSTQLLISIRDSYKAQKKVL